MQSDIDETLRVLMEQSEHLQRQLSEAQSALTGMEITGRGGDHVAVTFTGAGEPVSVSIDRAVVHPDDVARLERLLLTAITDACTRLRAAAEQMLEPMTDFFDGQRPPTLP